MYAAGNKCPHPAAAVAQKLRAAYKLSAHPEVQALTFRAPSPPKRPGDTLLIAAIFQGQEPKALCGTFNDLLKTVMPLAMALRGPGAQVSA